MSQAEIFRGYADEAAELVWQFEAISTLQVLAPVADWLPERPSYILDVGAGTGRDASWLAEEGHQVVAAEPVEALRKAGQTLHPSDRIRWLDDRLPGLERVRRTCGRFDLVLAVAVWQHLEPGEQAAALEVLASLMGPNGRLILSLRHGPGAQTRPCFPADPDRIIESAVGLGLRLGKRAEAESVQQKNREAGVGWTWLCFER